MRKITERVNERREGFVSPELPFLRDHGLAVSQERRHHPDRRSSSINAGKAGTSEKA
jgi:hypothetical protein